MTEQQQATITRNTRLTVGVATIIFGGIVMSLREQFSLSERLALINRDILEIRKSISIATDDRWKGQDMAAWARLLREMNQGKIQVPEPTRNQ